jgi:hypothetical protein
VSGRLEGCPVSVGIGSRVELAPCAAFELGRLFGSGGSGVTPPLSGGAWWAAPVLLAALRWNAVGPLFLQLSGGGGLTLIREDFVIHEPNQQVVHTVPIGFAEAGAALGIHFP